MNRSGIYTTHPRDARRARLLWALALAWVLALLANALSACGGHDARALDAELDAPDAAPDAAPPLDAAPGPWSVFAESHVSCPSMRAHPDTDRCTLLCDGIDCDAWHGGGCLQADNLCIQLGGRCARATDGLAYCVAP